MTDISARMRDLLRTGPQFALVCPSYPRPGRNGGEFVRTRVEQYAEAGVRGVVIEFSSQLNTPVVEEHPSGVVLRVPPSMAEDLLDVLARVEYPILAHSPSPLLQDLLVERVQGDRLVVWFHGYEVRDHRRLYGNYSARESPGIALHMRPPQRAMESARTVFRDRHITKVFVSQFQLQASEFDVGQTAENAVVIPNHIDIDLFKARTRTPEDATSILLMRSFRARNYGNDIALRALEYLSNRSGFSELQVTVRGFGPRFRAETDGVFRLENVDVVERYSSHVEMALAHRWHGIFLCPSRYDTQGVMLGEAMSSGMVCITNRVAAIPEYIDDTSGLLVKPDDPRAFGEAIWALVEQPGRMPEISRNAAARVRNLCGYDVTIARELQLIRSGGHP